jgi:hypothetical protein
LLQPLVGEISSTEMKLHDRVSAAVVMARSWGRLLRGHEHSGGRDNEKDRVMRQEEVAQLARLGIHPDRLAGRLRLVLTIGCYGDFRFTRDILSTGVKHKQIELAIQALVALGAHCDCGVFQAVGQLPRGVLGHHLTALRAE